MEIKTVQSEITKMWSIRIYAEDVMVAWVQRGFDGHSEPWFELQKMLDEQVQLSQSATGLWHWTWPCGDSYLVSHDTFQDEDNCREHAANCEAIVRKMVDSMEAGDATRLGVGPEVTP